MTDKNTICFFAVGCWNRGVVPEQGLVFDTIIKHQNEMDILLVLGDNVYTNEDSFFPDNPTKTGLVLNQHSLDVYNRGIDRILESSKGESLEKPVFFVLGNHDVSMKQNNCEIYNAQKQIHTRHPRLSTHFPYDSNIIFSKDRNTTVNLISIDTNFDELGQDYSKNSCIARNNSTHILPSGEVTTIQRMLRDQLRWLERELMESQTDYIVIMGHHPIVFNKTKAGKDKEGYIDALIDLFGRYAHKNITYLCADNHMYQDWNIVYRNETNVNQIICGTGGAKLDKGGNIKNNFTRNGVKFIRDKEITNTNGFVRLEFSKKNKLVSFFEVYKHHSGEGSSS